MLKQQKNVQKDFKNVVIRKLSSGLLANWGFTLNYDSATNATYYAV